MIRAEGRASRQIVQVNRARAIRLDEELHTPERGRRQSPAQMGAPRRRGHVGRMRTSLEAGFIPAMMPSES